MAAWLSSRLNGALPILQRELGAYFRSPVATVFLVVFLLAALGCPFFLGGFYRSNHAGLELFFAFHPWLYLFLVPALGMSVWAEEFQHSTILQLFTLPVSVAAAVIAKFLAVWIFLGLALVLTFPIVATTFYLGDPDIGPILTGYLGSFLMAGVYLAITTCTSAIGRNQIVSYVLSTIFCLVLVLLGQGALMDLLNPIFPVWLVDVISRFSFSTHFLSLGQGSIDSRDVIYFVSLIAFFLVANTIVVNVKIGRVQPKRAVRSAAQLLVALVCVNVLGHYMTFRFDATEDKIHTISADTRNILSGIKSPILLKFFFTQSNEDLPPQYKLYAQQVQTLLKEYVRLSNHKLTLEVVDPQPDTLEEDWAVRYGVRKTVLPSGSSLFFGLQALTMDREFLVPYFDRERAGQLEYDLSQRIQRISNERQERIGVIGLNGAVGQQFSGFLRELRRSYTVSLLPKDASAIDTDLAVLLLVLTDSDDAMQNISDAQEEQVQKFVQRGGKLLVLGDPVFRSRSPATATSTPRSPQPYSRLLDKLGLRVVPDEIVGDLKNAVAVQNPGVGRVRNPFLIRIGEEGLVQKNPMTRGLDSLVFLHSGHLQATTAPETGAQSDLVPLVVSSADSGAYRPVGSPILPLQKQARTSGANVVFPSLFSGSRETQSERDPQFAMGADAAQNTRDLQAVESKLRDAQSPKVLAGLVNRRAPNAERVPAAVVIADADFVSDDLAITRLQAAGSMSNTAGAKVDDALATSRQFDVPAVGSALDAQQSFQTSNDNIRFALNAIDFLLGNETLAGVRSRGVKSRDFALLRELEQAAQIRFLEAEEKSERNLAEIRQKLDEAMKSREKDQRPSLSEKQREEIQRYLDLEVSGKKDLAATRRLLRENIDMLGNRLLLLNLLPVPLLVALFGGAYFWRRSRRRPQAVNP